MSSDTEAGPLAGTSASLLAMMNGYRQTCVIVAAVRLGVFDRLAPAGLTDAALARALGADLPSLSRLLRGLVVLGLVEYETETARLTDSGRLLADETSPMYAWARLIAEEYLMAWAAIPHAVTTGQVAFDHVFGVSVWEHRRQNPELSRCFNVFSSSEQQRSIDTLLRAYTFPTEACVVDVGGGRGYLLAGVLGEYPSASGILLDLPHVVAAAAPALAEEGVANRCRIVGGSFLDGVPGGGDVYIVKHVLHNWDDAACVTILRHCREAMRETASLLIVENIVPDDPKQAAPLVMVDLHMMAVLGGRERTLAEFDRLLANAGLERTRILAGSMQIIEARRRHEGV